MCRTRSCRLRSYPLATRRDYLQGLRDTQTSRLLVIDRCAGTIGGLLAARRLYLRHSSQKGWSIWLRSPCSRTRGAIELATPLPPRGKVPAGFNFRLGIGRGGYAQPTPSVYQVTGAKAQLFFRLLAGLEPVLASNLRTFYYSFAFLQLFPNKLSG